MQIRVHLKLETKQIKYNNKSEDLGRNRLWFIRGTISAFICDGGKPGKPQNSQSQVVNQGPSEYEAKALPTE